MIDIQKLKSELRSNGVKATLTDLLALSSKNDPFGVFTKSRMAMASRAAQVWHEMGKLHGLHIRRMHYWLVPSDVQKPDGTLSEFHIVMDVDTEPPRRDIVAGSDGWLFDSRRDYLTPLEWYKRGGGEE